MEVILIMKKRLLSLAAIAMSLVMSSSAFAATARDSGDVDNSGMLAGGDLAKVYDSAFKGTNIENGNFDGTWVSTSKKVTLSDANSLLRYILQPESFKEDVAIRVYESKYDDVYNVYSDELVSAKNTEFDNTYTENSDTANVSRNDTILTALDKTVEAASSKGDRIAATLRNIYFTSDVKGDVYLTKKDGFAMFKYAMRYICPVDAETLAIVNKTASGSELYDEATTPENKKARYEAMKKLEALVLAADTGSFDLAAAYEQIKIIYPSAELPEATTDGVNIVDEYNKTYDEFDKIVKGKYTFSVNGLQVYDNNDLANHPGYDKLISVFAKYGESTINDVINEDGLNSKLEFVATNNKTGVTQTLTAELYVAGY